ncbi:anaphase-promoting complex subunit Cut9 [Saitoella coloradoensis]
MLKTHTAGTVINGVDFNPSRGDSLNDPLMKRATLHANALATPTGPPRNDPPHAQFTPPHFKALANHNISTLTISPLAAPSVVSAIQTSIDSPANISNGSFLGGKRGAPSRVERLRMWRHDALMQHQYEAAAFIGDKLLSMTGDPNDSFWLAQVYYSTGHYARAQGLLMQKDLLDSSVACRYLACLCLTKQLKWQEALDLLGEHNPFRSDARVKNQDGGIKLEASMCYLRGFIYAQMNNFDRAKECYKEAVQVDVKCFDAFDQLISNNLMTSNEEWDFVNNLDFNALEPEDAEFVKMIYVTKLNKFKASEEFVEAEERLARDYNLQDNHDLLLCRAEMFYVQRRYKACYEITKKILDADMYKFTALPIHVACMYTLGMKNDLFLFSHNLTDQHPNEAASWFAVAVYYFATNKITEARRYFSKASLMNPQFGPAWIGFAHCFAEEGEHDQAISAYSTAARLFQGTHLPPLFLGMEYLRLDNIPLAAEYFRSAHGMCDSDPLLLNELGVVAYHNNNLEYAVSAFRQTLKVAKEIESDERTWVTTWANLGHCCRKLRLFDEALTYFENVLRMSPRDAGVYIAIALIKLEMGKSFDALHYVHQALSVAPADPIASDVLQRALEANGSDSLEDSGLDLDGEFFFDDESDPIFVDPSFGGHPESSFALPSMNQSTSASTAGQFAPPTSEGYDFDVADMEESMDVSGTSE